MPDKKENLSLSTLFSELTHELRTLLHQEMALVRTEMSDKMLTFLKDSVFIGIGAIAAYTGVLVIIAAIVIGIGLVIPLWLSALLVGCVIIAIGVILIQKGRKDLKERSLTPERSAETLKETAKWAKTQLK